MNHQRLNNEGYADPTPYEAFREMEREERQAKRVFRPIVYICSPYAGDIATNVERARLYSRFAVDSGCIPLTVHLLYPQFMYDDDPAERELALRFGNILMGKCTEVWVFAGHGVSNGMASEIAYARRKGYRLRYFDSDCREVQG
ncbi:MAG: DUF4406 domain-containing protein [Sphaerochaeta sp.]|nr:DUF4406 domain-containing protein [Sphaerochaeta sp.]